MSFLISDAMAAASTEQSDPIMSFLPLIVIFVIFYFMLIRPQSKRAKEHKQMVDALQKGSEVVTSGGLLGKITSVGDNFISVQVADGFEVKVQRQSITQLMPKGTIKDA